MSHILKDKWSVNFGKIIFQESSPLAGFEKFFSFDSIGFIIVNFSIKDYPRSVFYRKTGKIKGVVTVKTLNEIKSKTGVKNI